MKFTKISSLSALLCFTFFIAITAAQDTETTGGGGGFSSIRNPLDLFKLMLLRPIQSTVEQAGKHLFSDDQHERLDNLRLRTYKLFMRLYNKTYSADEIPRRMSLFFRRREEIVESQKLFKEGRSSFAMKENEFTDWSDEELKKLTGVSRPTSEELMIVDAEDQQVAHRHRRSTNNETTTNLYGNSDYQDLDERLIVMQQQQHDNIPASMDWRKSGCVSRPINQFKCGACYAIATMSVVESMRCIKQVSSSVLSPQHIIDCASADAGYENYGCDGGWPTRVLKYLQDHRIAAREQCYPFVQRQNKCNINQVKRKQGCTVSPSVSGGRLQYKLLRNERDILYHVAKTGPVVTVMKTTDKFLYYSRGIFDDSQCSNRADDVDHAIVIVGYGRENNVNYWIIKNSWGTTTWGQGGYGLYRRGKNACSIGHWGWVVID